MPEWVQGFQGGLLLGVALSVALQAARRLWSAWSRGCAAHDHCPDCTGCLDGSGRALVAVEKLWVCPACGDTMPGAWAPPGALPVGECQEIQALLEGLPSAPQPGDVVSFDAAFRRLTAETPVDDA